MVNVNYDLRNTPNIPIPKSNKSYFLKSYLPSTIKLWNSLAENVRAIQDIDAFKNEINKLYKLKMPYKPFLTGTSKGHIYLARIRMALSGLNAHRKKFNFIEHSSCPSCTFIREDEDHYFLLCATYAATRTVMLDELQNLLPQYNNLFHNLISKSSRKKLLKIIIHGIGNEDLDQQIFITVSNYIMTTERFERN